MQVTKRRKWDDPGNGTVQPTQAALAPAFPSLRPALAPALQPALAPALISLTSKASTGPPPNAAELVQKAKETAAALASKFQQDAARSGKLPANVAIALQGQQADDRHPFQQEFFINDAPQHIRSHLIKRSVQDEVQQRTNTVIVTRGRYYGPGAPRDPSGELPLHLKIVPAASCNQDADRHRAVQAAIMDLTALLQGQPLVPVAAHAGLLAGGAAFPQPTAPPFVPLGPGPPTAQPGLVEHVVKLYAGFDAPPGFDAPGRISGPNAAYLMHIAHECQGKVSLHGKGVSPAEVEPLHLMISTSNGQLLEQAKSLGQNLLDTVRADFAKWQNMGGTAGPAPAKRGPQPLTTPATSQAPSSMPLGLAAHSAQLHPPQSQHVLPNMTHPGVGPLPPAAGQPVAPPGTAGWQYGAPQPVAAGVPPLAYPYTAPYGMMGPRAVMEGPQPGSAGAPAGPTAALPGQPPPSAVAPPPEPQPRKRRFTETKQHTEPSRPPVSAPYLQRMLPNAGSERQSPPQGSVTVSGHLAQGLVDYGND